VLLSPQDVVIECNAGEQISTHSAVLHLSQYFATILDDTDFDGKQPIVLPTSFLDPSKVREFVSILYDCLDTECGLLEHYITPRNVMSLAAMAHYTDVPLLHAACDKALANKHDRETWFPNKLLLLTKFSITQHLPLLRRACLTAMAADVDGSGLTAHLDKGRGCLAKDAVFMTELVTLLGKRKKTETSKFSFSPCSS
jgi:hypothetical protein